MVRTISLLAALVFGLSSTTHSATAEAAQDFNPKVVPKNPPQINPVKPNTSSSSQHTTPGVVVSMTVDRSGEILDLILRVSGTNNQTEQVRGCGAKSADHPLLNWAFQNKRLVHMTVTGGCFANVLIAS